MPIYRTTIPINLDAPMEETAGIILRACFYGVDHPQVGGQVPIVVKIVNSLIDEAWPRLLSDIRMAGIDEAGQERLRRSFVEEAWNQVITLLTEKPLTVKSIKADALAIERISGAGIPISPTQEELNARS